ncbi:MAG: 3-oxoacyl-ACP reductase FabG [Gemmatimonadetes bacterium]|nr:3-oxoacyl-ACP reductase FabG [Gemmatimonadota bacterium]MYK53979.1 3-oxoacyl-ACP reductase FabG [Gemmatimonadota bacterium]
MENDTKPSPLQGLEDRVAVVTGGSRGIGRAIARELARQGVAVAVNYTANAPAAASVVSEIERDGGQAMAIQADVSDRTAVEAMVQAAVQRFGSIDILVNNAGIDVAVSVLDTTDADWERIFAVNARGCFLCTQIAARVMIDAGGGGRIINISSLNAHLGWIARAAYSASKGAMEAFTRCCARDLGQYGITVNAVAPGAIRTDIWGDALTPGAEKAQAERVALGHIGEPEDVAGIVVFLASPSARFITGEVILVDGGRGTCDYLPTEHALEDKMYP